MNQLRYVSIPAVDAQLRREFGAIARDNRSGAAELSLRAIRALQVWLRNKPEASVGEFLEASSILAKCQPSMAPLMRLGNEIALSLDEKKPRRVLRQSLRSFRQTLQAGPARIARHFDRWLKPHPQAKYGHGRNIVTYSYSSTVARALTGAHRKIFRVACSESRPADEGRAMAQRLARAGLQVYFYSDAGLFSSLTPAKNVLVLGADAILADAIAGKVGIKVLVARALLLGWSVVFLADTTKLWPEPHILSPQWMWKSGPGKELWKSPPNRIQVYNPYFELAPLDPRIVLITERGPMSVGQVQRALKQIRISERMRGW